MNKKGFTLIELMIVIAIISILASIIVPNITRARARAQLTACIANLKQILTAYNMLKLTTPARIWEAVIPSRTRRRYTPIIFQRFLTARRVLPPVTVISLIHA